MPSKKSHHDQWLRACKKLKQASALLASAHGANRAVLLDAIERWTRIRDYAAFELIHGSAEESKRAWEAIVGPIESEPE